MRVTQFVKLFSVAVLTTIATTVSAAIIPGSLSETIVESRSGGLNFADYAEHGGGFPDSWANSTAKSSAPGVTAGIGSRFNSTAGFGAWFEVSPTLPTTGGIYEVYATTTSASGSITATTAVAVTGGSGLPLETPAFGTTSQNAWALIGTLKLDSGVDTPVVRFSEVTHSNRFYADAILFAEVVPEPATLALASMSMIGLVIAARRTIR